MGGSGFDRIIPSVETATHGRARPTSPPLPHQRREHAAGPGAAPVLQKLREKDLGVVVVC